MILYNRERLVVAHRPSAIAALDKLMMLRDGRMIAFGDKDDVLAKVLAARPGAEAERPQKLSVVGKAATDRPT